MEEPFLLKDGQLILNAFFVLNGCYPLHAAKKPLYGADLPLIESMLDRIRSSKAVVRPPNGRSSEEISRYVHSAIDFCPHEDELNILVQALEVIRCEATSDPYNMGVMVGKAGDICLLIEKIRGLERKIGEIQRG